MKEASMYARRVPAHPQMIQHFIFYFKNKLLKSNKKRSIPNHLWLHGSAIGLVLTSSSQSSMGEKSLAALKLYTSVL